MEIGRKVGRGEDGAEGGGGGGEGTVGKWQSGRVSALVGGSIAAHLRPPTSCMSMKTKDMAEKTSSGLECR